MGVSCRHVIDWVRGPNYPVHLLMAGKIAGSYEDSMVFTFWVHCIISAGYFEMIPELVYH